MDDHEEEKRGQESFWPDWMKSAADFWLESAKMWPAGFEAPSGFKADPKGFSADVWERWQSMLGRYQKGSSMLSSPEYLNSTFKGFHVTPEVSLKLMRTGWDGFFHLYKLWLNKLGKVGEKTEAYRFDNLDRDVYKAWSEYYRSEVQPFFNIPQVGLNRAYQEKLSRAADKLNVRQAAITEFIHLLCLPLERSIRVMEEKIETLAHEGKLSENFQEYYAMWIKILEGHYMNLFKSPEYLDSLAGTLEASQNFKIAQQEVAQDMLQFLPIPTRKDMEELYKELYQYKKTVKQLLKRVEKLEGSA